MKNLIDTPARYLAAILISALSVTADASDNNDKAKKCSTKARDGVKAVVYETPKHPLAESSVDYRFKL